MLKKEAIRFYGNAAKLAKALDIHRSAVIRWSKFVPMARAAKLHDLTSGRLKYDQQVYLDRQ
jgi:transcriptional repressor of cell division inhibition gene dicB